MELVALLGKGEGTWGQVAGVINKGDWESIILLGDNFAKQFTSKKDFEFIELKESSITELKEEILTKLKNKIKGTEVALSIASGDGKQHMALISALLYLPAGIRFTA
ncbi:MAG: hypothetical protein AABY22_24400, partial [Nanoarchaeota archaeon]